MKVAITGATGFLGRYLVAKMDSVGYRCRCWYRPASDRRGFDELQHQIDWVSGELGDASACRQLVAGCNAVVHSGLHRSGNAFRGSEGDLAEFVRINVLGTIQLIEAAAAVERFIYISSCAVHERIMDDRPLDETHPLFAATHYGAHKAAVEQFIHSYGFGSGYNICAVRPTGIYGIARSVANSKWFSLVQEVVRGGTVDCRRGGKEVHAADVAEAVELLLHADDIAGEVYNCCDRYISEWDIATLSRELSESRADIRGGQTKPKNQIVCNKIKALGLRFGGEPQFRNTVRQLVEACR